MTFWSLTNSDFQTNQTFHQFHDIDTKLHRFWVVSMEHLQRMWHASRERLPFRTPGSVPHCGTCFVLQLFKPDSSNLPCLYSTFHLEYPLVSSRFCLSVSMLILVFSDEIFVSQLRRCAHGAICHLVLTDFKSECLWFFSTELSLKSTWFHLWLVGFCYILSRIAKALLLA